MAVALGAAAGHCSLLSPGRLGNCSPHPLPLSAPTLSIDPSGAQEASGEFHLVPLQSRIGGQRRRPQDLVCRMHKQLTFGFGLTSVGPWGLFPHYRFLGPRGHNRCSEHVPPTLHRTSDQVESHGQRGAGVCAGAILAVRAGTECQPGLGSVGSDGHAIGTPWGRYLELHDQCSAPSVNPNFPTHTLCITANDLPGLDPRYPHRTCP